MKRSRNRSIQAASIDCFAAVCRRLIWALMRHRAQVVGTGGTGFCVVWESAGDKVFPRLRTRNHGAGRRSKGQAQKRLPGTRASRGLMQVSSASSKRAGVPFVNSCALRLGGRIEHPCPPPDARPPPLALVAWRARGVASGSVLTTQERPLAVLLARPALRRLLGPGVHGRLRVPQPALSVHV